MADDKEKIAEIAKAIKNVRTELKKVIIGQDEIIEQLFISLFAKGHCLLIGVPGLAKTLLIRTLAQTMDLKFNRIQFTPDLMPGDISGTEVIEDNLSTGQKIFRFVPGPIFANVVLADEINRTPPKTQSALLQAMEEHEVTAAGNTYTLEEPFFVLATQNPIEQEGTYPLPEAQLDRFMFNIWLDYPSQEEEIQIVKMTTAEYNPKVDKILFAKQILEFQEVIRRIPVADNVLNFAVKLVRATRPNNDLSNSNANINPTLTEYVKKYISYGAGPRASQYLIRGAKSRAALFGRFTPEIDDIKAVAVPVLRHRIVSNFNAEAENISSTEIINKIIENIK
jgi:MoxR-like ATPase